MLRIDRVLGSRLESEYSEEIHRLEHRGAVDLVNIPVADLARRRLLITTSGGEELAIALPRHQKLVDGAVLLLDGDRAILVRAASERWLRLEPGSSSGAGGLCSHRRNLHWRRRFGGARVRAIGDDHPAAALGELRPHRAAACVPDER